MVAADEKTSKKVTNILGERLRDGTIKMECTDDARCLAATFRQQPPDILIVFPEKMTKAAVKSIGILDGKRTFVIAVFPDFEKPSFRRMQIYPVKKYVFGKDEVKDLPRLLDEAEQEQKREQRIKEYPIQKIRDLQNEYKMVMLAEFEREMSEKEFNQFIRFFSRTEFYSSVFRLSPKEWAVLCTTWSEKEIRRHVIYFLKHFKHKEVKIRFAVSDYISQCGEILNTIVRLERLLKYPLGKNDKMILREWDFGLPLSDDVRQEVFQACCYVWKHFSKKISLEEIADYCSFSPAYLSEIFKKDVKMTLTDFIEYSRMAHAVNALVGSEEPIKDIAVMCGFHSASYFCKRFKETYGITAKQFRKREAEIRNRKLTKVRVMLGESESL